MIRAIEVRLVIPDNEAHTALATLQRLGVAVAALERADLYVCDVTDAEADGLVATVRGCETIFNPNKHELRVRAAERPGPGEVWVDELGADAPPSDPSAGVRIAGRTLAGVRSLERFTAWRLRDAAGALAAPEVVTAATETLLCNPAFQKATRA
jgi:hypothetical protein